MALAQAGQQSDAQPQASRVQTLPTPSTTAGPATAPVGASTPGARGGAAGYLQRQAFDCSDFQRKPDGSWAAVRAVVFPAPEGPLKIDVGSLFRPGQFAGGYDLGAMLQRYCPSG